MKIQSHKTEISVTDDGDLFIKQTDFDSGEKDYISLSPEQSRALSIFIARNLSMMEKRWEANLLTSDTDLEIELSERIAGANQAGGFEGEKPV